MDGSRGVSSLYIHVPFCARKCAYCAFYSESSGAELMRRYASALTTELGWYARFLRPKTIFFGGGTPSILPLPIWKQLLTAMAGFGWARVEEWTVECHPATVTLDKARLWRDGGVNRISLGVQSMDERLLDRLGRLHSRRMVFRAFELLRRAGFENINLDLMFGIPGQTMASWRETLQAITAFEPEHLSCYEVIYEEDTPLFEQLRAGAFDIDEDLVEAQYAELIEVADSHGFGQYEIANFARGKPDSVAGIPRRACRHNITYWQGRSFVGAGPSASGYLNGRRTRNISNSEVYCGQVEREGSPLEFSERLEPLARAGEIAAIGLRMNRGIHFADFAERTGFELPRQWDGEMGSLVRRGWAERDAVGFRLNSAGLRFADAAGAEFLRPEGCRG